MTQRLLMPGIFVLSLLLPACSVFVPVESAQPIDRLALVSRHHPQLTQVNPQTPFSLGNGRFAFTADVTGLQSLPEHYFAEGIPLETKARWAWHSRANPEGYSLDDAMESYPAYGRTVDFPTRMDSPAAQWLRQNPHDLPLASLGFVLDGSAFNPEDLREIDQELNLWQGQLHSRFQLAGRPVAVTSLVDPEQDQLAVSINSPLLAGKRLALRLAFPRGYDPLVKNTPPIVWNADTEHQTALMEVAEGYALFRRRIDDSQHFVTLRWRGQAHLQRLSEHDYRLLPQEEALQVFLLFTQEQPPRLATPDYAQLQARSAAHWADFWRASAAVDFSGSSHPLAPELERRIILSRYLLAIQARSDQPAQETGLTNSSWFGKHHSEMAWWHSAHWALWGQPEELARMLDWYSAQLDSARALAASRGLKGARWAKMVGPDNRESPGGNPLIIWNQPQPIHLAELLYQSSGEQAALLGRYAQLVEESADALASMLVWEEDKQRYSLASPIWIAQEIYDPRLTYNPGFELAYWREGLVLAQRWRERQGKARRADWQARIDQLAPLPEKDGKYVAIASIPDTFDKRASRRDHPSMLASWGLLADPRVEPKKMNATLDAVLASWDWEAQIWGWDYPMIAMTAARLDRPKTAVEVLLADSVHNQYLPNGHVPQPGSELRVYLPANGALLSAVAMMLGGWSGAPERPWPGFPDDGQWQIKAEGFTRFP